VWAALDLDDFATDAMKELSKLASYDSTAEYDYFFGEKVEV
jgi:hypothetical protein